MKLKTIFFVVGILAVILAVQVGILTAGKSSEKSLQSSKSDSSQAEKSQTQSPKTVPVSLRIEDTNDPKKFAQRVAEVALSWDHINYEWEDYKSALEPVFTPVAEDFSYKKYGYKWGGADMEFNQRSIEWVIPPDLDWAFLRSEKQVTRFVTKRVYEPSSEEYRRKNDIPQAWPKGGYILTVTGELHSTWIENDKPGSSITSHAISLMVECPPKKPCRLAGIPREVKY